MDDGDHYEQGEAEQPEKLRKVLSQRWRGRTFSDKPCCVCTVMRSLCESNGNRSTAQETDNQGIGKARTGWIQNLYMSEAGVTTQVLALKFNRSGRVAATALEHEVLCRLHSADRSAKVHQLECRRTSDEGVEGCGRSPSEW